MLEFLYEALRPVNLPFTALLGMVTFYWVLVSLGALDFNSEPHIDVAHDPHLDVHGHGDSADGAVDGAHGGLKSALQFLNFGNVPTMIVVSILSLSLWVCSMLSNYYFNDGSLLRTLVLLVPNIVLAAIITRLATTPLKKLFSALNREYDEHKPVVGRTCTILTSEVTDKFGQAQIETAGAPLIINVRTYGEAAFSRGESALIIKEDTADNIFTVAKLTTNNPTQEKTLI